MSFHLDASVLPLALVAVFYDSCRLTSMKRCPCNKPPSALALAARSNASDSLNPSFRSPSGSDSRYFDGSGNDKGNLQPKMPDETWSFASGTHQPAPLPLHMHPPRTIQPRMALDTLPTRTLVSASSRPRSGTVSDTDRFSVSFRILSPADSTHCAGFGVVRDLSSVFP
jgi:hypothetical protein